jgi:peptidoglycan endopeptidase LytE
MRLTSLTVLALTALLPITAAAGTITVKPGETLSDIAARYNVSTTALMRLNGISDPDHVEIAALYQVRSRDLMAVNGLQNADHVELGQTLKLPKNAVVPTQRPKPAPIKAVPGALEHTVGQGQTLTQIARAYQVPVASLISINSLENPDQVTVGTRLYLKPTAAPVETAIVDSATGSPVINTTATPTPAAATPTAAATVKTTATAQPAATVKTAATVKPTAKPQPKPAKAAKPTTKTKVIAKKADWRSYGPLQVDWANWQPMDGSHVVPTLNSQGQALYLAVNCSAGKLNVTGADGAWKAWAAPQNSFEKDLMKDRCKASVRA